MNFSGKIAAVAYCLHELRKTYYGIKTIDQAMGRLSNMLQDEEIKDSPPESFIAEVGFKNAKLIFSALVNLVEAEELGDFVEYPIFNKVYGWKIVDIVKFSGDVLWNTARSLAEGQFISELVDKFPSFDKSFSDFFVAGDTKQEIAE